MRLIFQNLLVGGPLLIVPLCTGCENRNKESRGVVVNSLCLEQEDWPVAVGSMIVSIVPAIGQQRFANHVIVFENNRYYEVDVCSRKASLPHPLPFPTNSASPVDLDGKGTMGVFLQGGGFTDIALLDEHGKVRWTRPGRTWRSGIHGDLDANGLPEFYVGGHEGIQCLPSEGKSHWEKNDSGPITHLAVINGSGVSRNQVLISLNQTDDLDWHDAGGSRIRRIEKNARILDMTVAKSSDADSEDLLVLLQDSGWRSRIKCLDTSGNERFTHALDSSLGKFRGLVAARGLKTANGETCIVVLGHGDSSSGNGVLVIFSIDGTLVYAEKTGRSYGLLGVRHDCSGVPSDIIVIGDNRPQRMVSFAVCPRS